MQKSFRIITFTGLLFICVSGVMLAQNKPTYKDVLLNGKPAKLNMATGEFILVNGKTIDTIKPLELNSKEAPKSTGAIKTSEVKAIDKSKETVSENTPTFHTVVAGETLFGLSKKYGVSLSELMKGNSLETTLVYVGQKLRVKDFDKIEETVSDSTTWTVSKGDTLYSIAKKSGTTVNALKELNGLKSNTILVGQELLIK